MSKIAQDVRMVELTGGPRLDLEPAHPIGVISKARGQDLHGDVAPEPRIVREEHLAHAARAEQRANLVGADASAWTDRHVAKAARTMDQV